jgi:predicted glycosyltransferase involved in capsule biosynthesis
MNPSIIIPTNNSPERQDIESWVINWYQRTFPAFEIFVSHNDSDPFNKARAINNGVERVGGNVLVIIDADTVITPDQLALGLTAGDWVVPFNKVQNLTKDATQDWIKDGANFEKFKTEKVRQNFVRAGGVWIIKREIFELVGGVDERYAGWGGEDDSFCRSVNTLYEPLVMVRGSIYHLWHTEAYARKHFMQSPNYPLWRAYCRATGDKEKIRTILNGRGQIFT